MDDDARGPERIQSDLTVVLSPESILRPAYTDDGTDRLRAEFPERKKRRAA